MYDVITVGSATVDVFIDTDSELIKIKSARGEEELLAYPSGSKILIKDIEFMTGGGGTNTAVALAKLGHKVGFLGKIGNDPGGMQVMDLLEKYKIDYLGIKGREMTGYSIILDSIERDRTILTYKGAIDTFRFSEINTRKLRTKWFYFSSLVEKSYKVLEQLVNYAKKNKIKVCFNPSHYLAEKGSIYLSKVISGCSIIVLNKEEAECVVGRGSVKDMLTKLSQLGPEIVVITDGEEGAYCFDGKHYYFVEAHRVRVVETTGAGDSFAAGFLSGYIRKNDVKFALKMGLANAESVVQTKGAKGGLLGYRQTLRVMKNMPGKIRRI